MSKFPTGAPMLDGAIVTLINWAKENNEPLTAANLSLTGSQKFGATFPELSQQEVDDAVAWLASREPVAIEAAEAEQPAAPTMTRDEAMECVQIAADNVFACRREVAECERVRKEARAAQADAIMVWQRGGKLPMTRDELIRETLRSNQLEREQNAGFSRTAITTKQFVQKRMRTGNRRGSVSLLDLQHMRIKHANEKAALAAAAKLPSER